MKQEILNIIKLQDGKLSTKNLSQKLQISEEELKKTLLELKLNKEIIELSNKLYIFKEDNYIGKISISKSSNKIIYHEGNIYPISHEFINNVLINDIVTFTINDKQEAVITSIIDRTIKHVTCQVKIHNKKKKLECFHKGIEVTLSNDDLDSLKDGDIILVNIDLKDIEQNHYEAKLLNIIGNASDPNIDELTIALNYGFDNYYSEEYLEELEQIPLFVSENDCINRTDLRHLNFVTIDGIDAKDMDDAIYAERKDFGYRMYVSISDVSHYIKYGTEIFNRAYDKATSYYANNIVFHMLHSLVSNGICSLNPNVDRLTKTVIIDIDTEGNIISSEIVKSVINSKMKMNYNDVDELLINNNCKEEYKPYEDLLKLFNSIRILLEQKAKYHNGKIDFPSNELVKTYDELGNVKTVKQMENTPARRLIEYFMITANQCVASYIYWWNIPSIYRIHDIPNLKKVNETLRTINENDTGIKFKSINSVKKPHVIQAILHKLSETTEYPILANLLLQNMQRAEYNTQNIGHYALGLEFYTHFTSPIRRLCDLLIHMLLDAILENYELINTIDFKKLEIFLQEASKQASRMERQADAGEYESSRLAIIKSMEHDIGNEFEAIVLDVSDDIKIKVNGIETYVKYKYLSDNFAYDNKSGKYYDKYNNKILRLGSKIIIKLLDVNTTNRTIKVEILSVTESKKLVRK